MMATKTVVRGVAFRREAFNPADPSDVQENNLDLGSQLSMEEMRQCSVRPPSRWRDPEPERNYKLADPSDDYGNGLFLGAGYSTQEMQRT